MIDMCLDGGVAHNELRRDLRIAMPLRDQPHDLQLACGQLYLLRLG